MSVMVPVSWGELIDKVTILEIKAERIAEPAKTRNVRRELEALWPLYDRARGLGAHVAARARALKAVNEALWTIEDEIRDCERRRDFGPRFVALARSVYQENDRRARVKRELNELLGSELVEEKSYRAY